MAYKTPNQLTAQTTGQDSDLLVSWRGAGPLKNLTLALLRTTYLDTSYVQRASNLSDLANAGAARTNLGLGTAATKTAGTAANNVLLLDGSGKAAPSILPTLVAGQVLTNDGSSLSWATVGVTTRQTKAINYAIQASDKNTLISCTAAITLTFPAAATATGVFPIYIKNENINVGSVTVVRSGSDTLDGLTSYIMYPGEMRQFFSDGVSAWVSEVLTPFYNIWTATDSAFAWPPGYQAFEGHAWSGGAGGSSASAGGAGGGGGAGGCVPYTIQASAITVGAAAVITIGAGGSGAPSGGNAGGAGGATSIASLVSVNGAGAPGSGGGGGTGSGVPADGGTASGSGIDGGSGGNTTYGGGGGASATVSANNGGIGGSSMYGGGGGGGGAAGAKTGGAGGTSKFGGAGGAGGNPSAAGAAGTAPGGGGGGAGALSTGGAGARGEVRMRGIV